MTSKGKQLIIKENITSKGKQITRKQTLFLNFVFGTFIKHRGMCRSFSIRLFANTFTVDLLHTSDKKIQNFIFQTIFTPQFLKLDTTLPESTVLTIWHFDCFISRKFGGFSSPCGVEASLGFLSFD